MRKRFVNIVFFSHEVGAVSHVLTGRWNLSQVRDALMKSVVFKNGIYETQPGQALTELRRGFELCGMPTGEENQVVLNQKSLLSIMSGTVPATKEDWILIEMPWGDIVVGGTTPTRKVTKQSWMKDWCNGNR
jgi:hypothetical protein